MRENSEPPLYVRLFSVGFVLAGIVVAALIPTYPDLVFILAAIVAVLWLTGAALWIRNARTSPANPLLGQLSLVGMRVEVHGDAGVVSVVAVLKNHGDEPMRFRVREAHAAIEETQGSGKTLSTGGVIPATGQLDWFMPGIHVDNVSWPLVGTARLEIEYGPMDGRTLSVYRAPLRFAAYGPQGGMRFHFDGDPQHDPS
jgi:hypothetical protein